MPDQRDAGWHEPVPGAAAHAGANEEPNEGAGEGVLGSGAADGGDVVHTTAAPSGLATSASGGYGTGSGGEVGGAEEPPTSGGSGDGDERTSVAGDDAETEWLRRAQGGPR